MSATLKSVVWKVAIKLLIAMVLFDCFLVFAMKVAIGLLCWKPKEFCSIIIIACLISDIQSHSWGFGVLGFWGFDFDDHRVLMKKCFPRWFVKYFFVSKAKILRFWLSQRGLFSLIFV